MTILKLEQKVKKLAQGEFQPENDNVYMLLVIVIMDEASFQYYKD